MCDIYAITTASYYCRDGVEIAASRSGTGGGGVVLASCMAVVGRP